MPKESEMTPMVVEIIIKRIFPNFGILCLDNSFGVKLLSEFKLVGGIIFLFIYLLYKINSPLARRGGGVRGRFELH